MADGITRTEVGLDPDVLDAIERQHIREQDLADEIRELTRGARATLDRLRCLEERQGRLMKSLMQAFNTIVYEIKMMDRKAQQDARRDLDQAAVPADDEHVLAQREGQDPDQRQGTFVP